MSVRLVSFIGVVFLSASLGGPDAFAFLKRKDKTTVFDVPTTGKILDVKYHPEFDEWWVHCREGETIAIYTYDHKSRSWGKVQFRPKKHDEKGQKVEKTDRAGQPDDGEAVAPKDEQKPDQPKIEPKREPEKEPKKPDRKWWDPLKILPGVERPKQEGK
jgi:hypothetical protein